MQLLKQNRVCINVKAKTWAGAENSALDSSAPFTNNNKFKHSTSLHDLLEACVP